MLVLVASVCDTDIFLVCVPLQKDKFLLIRFCLAHPFDNWHV